MRVVLCVWTSTELTVVRDDGGYFGGEAPGRHVRELGAPTLLRNAIAASGLSARSFAALLGVDERTVRRWLAGDREIPGPVLVICPAILRDPAVVAALAPPKK